MAGLSMIGLLAHFVRLATATCSQCGDDNPYLDNADPNFFADNAGQGSKRGAAMIRKIKHPQ